jgi:alanine or glycine:cation symporter, AGCS family
MMVLAMAVPNIFGCYLLSNKVAADLQDYMRRLQTGKMLVYK